MAEGPTAPGRKPDPYDVDFSAMLRAVPVKRIIIGIITALAALYAGDLAYIHLCRDKFDTVRVLSFYAEALKGNKIDFQPEDSTDVRCVNSLFPHFGAPPCWYLRRHQDVRIDI